MWKFKGFRRANIILKKNKVGGFPLSNFKTAYIARVIKTL